MAHKARWANCAELNQHNLIHCPKTVLTFFALGIRGCFGAGAGSTFSFPPSWPIPRASNPPCSVFHDNKHEERTSMPTQCQWPHNMNMHVCTQLSTARAYEIRGHYPGLPWQSALRCWTGRRQRKAPFRMAYLLATDDMLGKKQFGHRRPCQKTQNR